jgi:hypothetical protein
LHGTEVKKVTCLSLSVSIIWREKGAFIGLSLTPRECDS